MPTVKSGATSALAMKHLAKWIMAAMAWAASIDVWGGESPAMIIRSGDVEVAIPHRNAVDSVPAWLRLLRGLRNDASTAAVVFPGEELKASLPNLPSIEDIRGTVTVYASISDVDALRAASLAEIADIWFGRGRFAGRVAERIHDGDITRVFDRWQIETRSAWTVVAYPPGQADMAAPQDDRYVVGRCQLMGPKGSQRTSCLSSIQVGRVAVSVYMSEANLLAFPEVHDEIRRQVAAWTVSP